MNIKLCLFFAIVGSISAQGIIDYTAQGIRSQYLSDKGNLIQRCDTYFFNIYNRLKSITDNIINSSTKYLPNWKTACSNFAMMNKTKGSTIVNNYCKQIIGALNYPTEAQKEWMVSFYYNELGHNTDFIDAAADVWVGVEDHLNSILDLQQRNADCVKTYAKNYTNIYMPYFTIIYNVYYTIYSNETSFFKKTSDAANLVSGTVYNLYTSLNSCINNSDAANCVSKFISTNVNDCQTSGCKTAYDIIQTPAKNFQKDLTTFKDFYDSQISSIKDYFSSIEDNMNAWTQSVNDCILNGGPLNFTTTTTSKVNSAAVTTSTTTLARNLTTTASSNANITTTTVKSAAINGSIPAAVVNGTAQAASNVNGTTTTPILTTTTTVKLGNGPIAASNTTNTTIKGNSSDQKVKASNSAAAAASQNGKPAAAITTTTTKKAQGASITTTTTKQAPTTIKGAQTTVKSAGTTTKTITTTQKPTTKK
ncbi:hypothetical protein PVAND_016654 [Polypedilum vanderplanki]|uniref:Uncharacterized protein n=1 Tax=Polypedilum vanderplanki TaxID=319348 RepID=A0A9J6BGL1_POLVA|nr:hypothetical protein PVAND_016654 [Polypedilum vanderplanki]